MTQFKIGDRVRQVGDPYWRGVEGIFAGRKPGRYDNSEVWDYFVPDYGSCYSDGKKMPKSFCETEQGMSIDSFELIRPTQTATGRLERLEAFVAKVAAIGGSASIISEAKELVDEIAPPVDPDVLMAREICALAVNEFAGYSSASGNMLREGHLDHTPAMVKCVEAIRQARNTPA